MKNKKIKFVIWGAGTRGVRILEFIGNENIAVFVDEHYDKKNKIDNINVISPETFYSDYSDFPVIITPKGFENEIANVLKSGNIILFFHYLDTLYGLEGLYSAPKDKLLNELDKKRNIILYGISVLSLIVYEWLSTLGYNCSIIPLNCENDMSKTIAKRYSVKMCTYNDIKSNDIVLETSPLLENDKPYIEDKCFLIKYYYNLGMRRELFKNKYIEKFHNIHKSKRGFIVLTGPSLKIEDLDKLYINNEICISVNSIFKSFDETKWRPDYYMVVDIMAVRKFKNEILSLDIKNKFIGDTAWKFDDETVHNDLIKWHLIKEYDHRVMPSFTDDFSVGSYVGYTVAYDGALQFAAYLGFSEIYLLGADCHNYSEDKQHFHGSDKTDFKSILDIERITLAYQSAKKYADEHGIKIYNATRGGNLEVFERVDFDELF